MTDLRGTRLDGFSNAEDLEPVAFVKPPFAAEARFRGLWNEAVALLAREDVVRFQRSYEDPGKLTALEASVEEGE